MLEYKRVREQTDNNTGLVKWFFRAREGDIGPFSCQEEAADALQKFIHLNIKNCNDGGRGADKFNKFDLLSAKWDKERAQLEATINELLARKSELDRESSELQTDIDKLNVQILIGEELIKHD